MVVEELDSGYWLIRDAVIIEIPNFSPIFNVDVKRSIGVERGQLATVENGYLTKYDLTKNSEALAIIEAPIELVKDVGGIFPSLIGIETDRASNLTKLYKAQQDLFSAQQAGLTQQTTATSDLQVKVLAAQKKVIEATAELEKSKADLNKLQTGQ